MTKHTPGPWFVRDFRASEMKRLGWEGEFVDRILITNKDGAGISDCVGKDCVIARITLDNRPFHELLGEGNLADARLMAAAPDLLDAVNSLLGLLQLVSGRPDIPSEVRDALRSGHRIDEARAAIAKASGEEVPA